MHKTSVVILAASAALAVTSAPASARSSATCPHSGTVDGIDVLIECGPARAIVHFGSAKIPMKNGQCVKTSSNFGLNFGDIVAGPTTKRPPDAFVVIAGPHGGTATLQIARSGKRYIGDTIKLKLNASRSAGTLTGVVTLASGNTKVKVSASFSC